MRTRVRITDDSPVGMYPKYKKGQNGFVDGYIVEHNEDAKAVVVRDDDGSFIPVPLNEIEFIGGNIYE